LIRLADDDFVLAIVLHHIISDGWSLGVLFRELQALYCGESVSELPIQYADYAVWKRKSMQGPALQRELDYWKQKLAGAQAALELPVDHSESERPSLKANRCILEIPDGTRRLITEAAQRQGDTPFILLTAALAIRPPPPLDRAKGPCAWNSRGGPHALGSRKSYRLLHEFSTTYGCAWSRLTQPPKF